MDARPSSNRLLIYLPIQGVKTFIERYIPSTIPEHMLFIIHNMLQDYFQMTIHNVIDPDVEYLGIDIDSLYENLEQNIIGFSTIDRYIREYIHDTLIRYIPTIDQIDPPTLIPIVEVDYHSATAIITVTNHEYVEL